jgi:HK97 gp10 family phage protein
MADVVTVKVEGLAEIERKLRQLPERLGRNAMKRALRKGANVIKQQAQANAKAIDDPATREQISKNIAVASGSRKREREAGGLLMRIGVSGGARPTSGDNGQPGGNTTHWRFVEFGTSTARAQPFMRPAMANAAERAMSVTTEAMSTEIDKELAKL